MLITSGPAAGRRRAPVVLLLAAGLVLLPGCFGGKDSSKQGGGTPRVDEPCIKPDAQARDKILTALFEARAGDVVELCEGKFDLPTGLLINSKSGITLKGAGMKKTILSFANSDSAEGINASHADGLVLQGFTVEDTPGNGIRIFRSDYVTVRDVSARWRDAAGRDETEAGYTPRSDVGAYALYPVETRHVLMENCEAHGASDAGIYVGQSSDVLVRNCLATYNVAGYEFENTYRAIFEYNVATKNTGGFLIFDLPNLRQYGEKNIVRYNKAYANNTNNFAPIGNIVGLTPRGTGMLILASDQLEIYGNEITDNETLGIAMVNYGLVDNNYPDMRYDFYSEGVEIYDNTFARNGTKPQMPIAERGIASALPLILRVKNLGRGADIVWDGGEDTPNDCTEYPRDKDGIPLNQPNPNETGRYEARVDERGRPNFDRPDQEPTCKYNAWKFDTKGKLKKPENGICIHGNKHENNPLVTPFLNAKLWRTDLGPELVVQLLTPGSNDLSPHACDLPDRPEPVLKLPYVPKAEEQRPSESAVAKACAAVKPGQVNWSALGQYNCPELSQYGLFSVANDPGSAGNGDGVMPYELNSALFSDYASKYRVIFLPPGAGGTVQRAIYQDSRQGVTATLDFPVGTVIAKTFAFRKEDSAGKLLSEHVVETRLLIKRQTGSGVSWVGLPYIWQHDAAGKPVKAVLALAGGTASVSWDYLDHNPNVKKDGKRVRYTGSAEHYAVPAALNCITCHGGDDREPGAAPIGPKARNMDRGMNADGSGQNQLAFMVSKGWLDQVPATHDRPLAFWDVPGSGPSSATGGSPRDVHERVRAYLESNCMHCHNPNGGASNSGLYLDSFRTVNNRFGVCKKPVAAGRGSGSLKHDIVPGDAGASILMYRVASAEAGVRMAPIARSVTHTESAVLINEWINTALPALDKADDNEIQDEDSCNSSDLPLLLTELLPAELTGLLKQLQKLAGGDPSALEDILGTLTGGLRGLLPMTSADQRRELSLP
ncbi:parallel beta-helix domain-containing protein [Amnimonas aquatica]|nr:parallel beta-helix domain-containing protein [Amnimonas aquatica]